MKSPAIRGLLLSIAALAILAVAAVPAHASVTPANTAVRATSGNSNLTDDGTGLRTRCPLSTFDGRTTVDGRGLSGTLNFTRSGAVTCTESLFGSSVTVVCRGTVTLRSTSSVASTSASGTAALDSDFECTIDPDLASARSIRGPQTLPNCRWTFTTPDRLRTDCRGIRVDGGGTSAFAGDYRANRALTIS